MDCFQIQAYGLWARKYLLYWKPFKRRGGRCPSFQGNYQFLRALAEIYYHLQSEWPDLGDIYKPYKKTTRVGLPAHYRTRSPWRKWESLAYSSSPPLYQYRALEGHSLTFSGGIEGNTWL